MVYLKQPVCQREMGHPNTPRTETLPPPYSAPDSGVTGLVSGILGLWFKTLALDPRAHKAFL